MPDFNFGNFDISGGQSAFGDNKLTMNQTIGANQVAKRLDAINTLAGLFETELQVRQARTTTVDIEPVNDAPQGEPESIVEPNPLDEPPALKVTAELMAEAKELEASEAEGNEPTEEQKSTFAAKAKSVFGSVGGFLSKNFIPAARVAVAGLSVGTPGFAASVLLSCLEATIKISSPNDESK